jgi:predicted neutral ceramidase superfamily lipid hydrolase
MKRLKLYFTLAMLLPWMMVPIFFKELTINQILFLVYFGIFLSVPLFHLLGKEKGHLFDFSKLVLLYGFSLLISLLLAGMLHLFEKIEFQKAFLSLSFVVYPLQFIFLTINLKK